MENLSQKNLLVVNNKYCSILMKLNFQFIDKHELILVQLNCLILSQFKRVNNDGHVQPHLEGTTFGSPSSTCGRN